MFRTPATGGARTLALGPGQGWNRWAVDPEGRTVAFSIPTPSPTGGVWIDNGVNRQLVASFPATNIPQVEQLQVTANGLYVLVGNAVSRYSLPGNAQTVVFLPQAPSHFSLTSGGRWYAFSHQVTDSNGPVMASFMRDNDTAQVYRLSAENVESDGTAFSDTHAFWLEARTGGSFEIMRRATNSLTTEVAVPASVVGAAVPRSLDVTKDGSRLGWISESGGVRQAFVWSGGSAASIGQVATSTTRVEITSR